MGVSSESLNRANSLEVILLATAISRVSNHCQKEITGVFIFFSFKPCAVVPEMICRESLGGKKEHWWSLKASFTSALSRIITN